MPCKHWIRERWKRNSETISGMVYGKSRCGFRKAMVEKKLVLFVLWIRRLRWIIQFDTIVYSAGNKEPHLTGMVIRYLLVSNNARAIPCERRHGTAAALSSKHHENGNWNATKVSVLPVAFPCKCSLGSFACWLSISIYFQFKHKYNPPTHFRTLFDF